MAISVPSYLYLNQYGVYYFRIAIPQDLRDLLGKREIKKSLRTSNRRQAILMAQKLAGKVSGVFEEMRSMEGKKNPDTGIIILKGLKKDKDGVSVDEFHVDLDDKQKEVDLAKELFASLADNPQALKDVTDAATAATEKAGKLLSQLIDEYCAENKANWTAGTLKEFRSMFDYITEILDNLPVGTIGYSEARKLKKTLLALPPNRKTIPRYRKMSIDELQALKPEKTLSRKTVNKYLALMSSLFDYAVSNGYSDNNYFKGVSVKIKQNQEDKRSPFNDDDLTKLFSPEVFKPKPLHSYMFWTPLIGLYTGMRIEEICQLHLEDLRKVDDIWVFDIKAEGDRTVKTASGIRKVPIHSELIRTGILDRATRLKKRGQKMLFPELKPDKLGKYSARVSKWFNARYRPQCGVTETGKVFHSFRHTVNDKLKQLNVDRALIKAVMGHKSNDMTDHYGDQYGPQVLKPVIEQLDFQLPPIQPFK